MGKTKVNIPMLTALILLKSVKMQIYLLNLNGIL